MTPKDTEYIIQEFSVRGDGWFLLRVIGKIDEDKANKILEEVKKENPTKKLRLYQLEASKCWWNDPFLRN